jgi:hypothetical protein
MRAHHVHGNEDCVRFRFITQIGIIVLLAGVSSAPLKAWPHKHGQDAHVRFLATSTLIRSNWGQNEDTYLAELSLSHDTESILVRLVYVYPNEAPPLSREQLTVPTGIEVHVRRDQECDRPYREMLLRSAPGDPIAIVPIELHYQPQFDREPSSGTILPCYRIEAIHTTKQSIPHNLRREVQ